MSESNENRQWEKLGELERRLSEHEVGCERRNGAITARLDVIETRLESMEKTLDRSMNWMRNIFVSLVSGGGVVVALAVWRVFF